MVNAMDACPLHRNARRIIVSKEKASKKNAGDEFDFRNSGATCTSVHYVCTTLHTHVQCSSADGNGEAA